jgi:hypothetical protein
MNDFNSNFERGEYGMRLAHKETNEAIEWGWAIIGYGIMALVVILGMFVSN